MGVVFLVRTAGLVLAAWAALCLAPVKAQDAEHLALAQRYLELSEGENLRQTMSGLLTQELSKEEMADDERRWFIDQFTTMFLRVMDQVMVNMRDDVARIFTKDELRAAIAFMESPVGRAITQKSFELGVVMQQELEPLLIEGMLGVFEKYCMQFSCPESPGAVSRK